MGYQMQNGRYAPTESVILAAPSARTASASGSAYEMGERSTLRLLLDVTVVSGTNPTLDAYVETSNDGSTWRTLGTFAQKVAASSERQCFAGCDRFVRVSWEIGGTSTPTFTFSITGEAAG